MREKNRRSPSISKQERSSKKKGRSPQFNLPPITSGGLEIKWVGPKGKSVFKKMKENVEQKGGRNQMFREKQSRLAKAEGVSLEGDFEQRRSDWGKTENTAACCECGNADHFTDHRPIWIGKKKKRAGGRPTTNTKEESERSGRAM